LGDRIQPLTFFPVIVTSRLKELLGYFYHVVEGIQESLGKLLGRMEEYLTRVLRKYLGRSE